MASYMLKYYQSCRMGPNPYLLTQAEALEHQLGKCRLALCRCFRPDSTKLYYFPPSTRQRPPAHDVGPDWFGRPVDLGLGYHAALNGTLTTVEATEMSRIGPLFRRTPAPRCCTLRAEVDDIAMTMHSRGGAVGKRGPVNQRHWPTGTPHVC